MRFPDPMTSNEAEYQCLIAAVEDLIGTIVKAGRSPADFSVEIKGDSRLVLNQVGGSWKIKSLNLLPLLDRAEQLLSQMGSFEVTWQPRQETVKLLGH